MHDNILKRNAAAGGEKANFAHRTGLEVPLSRGECPAGQVDGQVKFPLKNAHRFGVVAVVVRDQQSIDFGNIATVPGESKLGLPSADSRVEEQSDFGRLDVETIAVTS